VFAAVGDIAGIREAYKRLGLVAAAKGNIADALRYFDQWQYAYATFTSSDKFEYDWDILECVDRLALPYRLSPNPRAGALAGKIRVAYLVKGICEAGSILVKINLLFAKYHDEARFTPKFFVPESERTVRKSSVGLEHVRLFEQHRQKLVMSPDAGNSTEGLLATARSIHEFQPDVLVTSASLAQFAHYFVTALQPAPVTIGLVQGPPPQFAPMMLDWGIAWIKHPLMDCPVSCSLADMEFDLPSPEDGHSGTRQELGLPAEAIVACAAGRYVKFQDVSFWKAIVDILKENPGAYFVALGVDANQLPLSPSVLTAETGSRLRLIGWSGGEYLKHLRMADILIDTFPSGGGAILVDAMALGIPVVSFENDYMKLYDQTEWSLAEEVVGVSEMIVPRGDWKRMSHVVSRLMREPAYRERMGERCRDHARQTRSDPARTVRKCEQIIMRVLERRASGTSANDSDEADTDRAVSLFPRNRLRQGLLAKLARRAKRGLSLGVRVLDRISGDPSVR
jgi:glycosyltransferase involved in cell wall biosynthesis